MVIEIAAVCEVISNIPHMIKSIDTIASQLKIGFWGSGDVNKLKDDLKVARETLRKIGIIGLCIRDYNELSGIVAYNSRQVDNILKSTIPNMKKLSDSITGNIILEQEYDTFYNEFKRLKIYFDTEHYIDERDKGTISTFIDQINSNLLRGETFIEKMNYDESEKILKGVSDNLTIISSVCTRRIEQVSLPLITYQHNLI